MRSILQNQPLLNLGLVCTECRGLGPTKPKAPSNTGEVVTQKTMVVTSTVALRLLSMNGPLAPVQSSSLSSVIKVIVKQHKDIL